MNDEVLPYFKIGYSLNKECGDGYWDNLELMIAYRTALTYMALAEIETVGIISDTEKIKKFFSFLMSQDDVMDAMTMAMKSDGGVV